MLGPFPGMDPYMEAPDQWRSFHSQILVDIARDLQPQVAPAYVVRTEQRVIVGPLEQERWPDVHIREPDATKPGGVAVAPPPAARAARPERIEAPELMLPHRYLIIRAVRSREVITVIEVLSPWNKTGRGLADYREKQEEVLLSTANLVEIDLLRGGGHAVAVPAARLEPSDYRVCIHLTGARHFDVLRFGVRDPLPDVPVPLRAEDPDVPLHLSAAFAKTYEAGIYAQDIDYSGDPVPPLPPADAEWARERIGEWKADRKSVV